MRNIFLLLFVLFCSISFADQITYPTIWGVNDTVTNVKLNNNDNSVSNVVNGNLDNGNMKSGYALFQTVSVLPTAGTQGRVDFLTSDNSLNLDNGATWLKTITPSGTLATGQIPLYNSSWGLLSPGTQYYSLVSNGPSSLPSYQQVSLVNGVTANLPVTNLDSGTNADSSHYWRGDGTWANPDQSAGAWASGTFNSPTQVNADSCVTFYGTISSTGQATFKTDSSNPPTTIRAYSGLNNAGQVNSIACIVVKKNDYYLIQAVSGSYSSTNVYVIPLR